jgi:hypothetical protein
MRDIRSGTATKKPKQKRRELPPISPRGFATDVTPRTHKVSREARGAAMLMRPSFETYMRKHDLHLGPGEQKALRMLKEDHTQLLRPKNHQYLAALQRATPDTNLGRAIAQDSHAASQHQKLLAGVSHAPTSAKISDIAKLPPAEQQSMLATMPNVAHHGIGWASRLAEGASNSVIGTAPFLYHMATTDPRKSLPEVGGALAHSFGETARHPVRQLRQDPFAFFANTLGVVGGGVGAGGRLGSLGRAVAERGAGESALGAATRGFTHPQVRSLIDLYESKSPGAQVRIARENENIAKEILTAMDMPSAKIKGVKGRTIATWRDVKESLAATRKADEAHPRELMEQGHGFIGPAAAHVLSSANMTLRELTDGVRAGAIYLRPAYLPNNWAGNLFMNMTHQGFVAPVNLAKSVIMHRQLTARELRGLRAATGQTAAHAIMGKGRGYMRSLTDPVAHTMGRIADQPFRDAALLHELRRVGYRKISDVKALVRKADNGDHAAIDELANAGRKAQEEIVKFARLSDTERNVIRNVFFVWNWVKGASRYAARYPLAHPVQTAVYQTGGKIGNQEVQSQIGGLPPYLVGNIPVGHGRLSNPFALNPLGTAVQVGRAAQGTIAQLRGGGKFDPHTMEDWTSLTNPVLGGLIEAREGVGGRSYVQNVIRNIAPYNLYQGLAHPGSGSTFPGTRTEAVGHYVFGSLYPRKYDPKAIQAALERMNVNHPEKLIPEMVKKYEAKTGQKVPPELVSAYRRDLHELKAQKDFKSSFAHKHNTSSYRRLPAINKAQAAIQYLDENHVVPKDQIREFKQALESMPDDQAANDFANGLWSITNVGSAKRAWNALMASRNQGELTRAK